MDSSGPPAGTADVRVYAPPFPSGPHASGHCIFPSRILTLCQRAEDVAKAQGPLAAASAGTPT